MKLPVIELAGTPQEMGRALGEACRDMTGELYELRMREAVAFAGRFNRQVLRDEVLGLCQRCLDLTHQYDPRGYEELIGIAEGSGLTQAQVYAANCLTDVQDVLGVGDPRKVEACTSSIICPDRALDGRILIGENWDLQTNHMPYVVLVRRRPDSGPRTCSLTLSGCISLIGMNSEGIAVGMTNLRTTDARPGVAYVSMVHKALGATTLDDAVSAIRDAPRAAAHYYFLAGPDGVAWSIECSATRQEAQRLTSGAYAHCNHILSQEIRDIEVPNPTDSTCQRQDRMGELLATHHGEIGVDDLKRFFSDHDGGEQAICRHNVGVGISTNACIIMSPTTRQMHACRGYPHEGTWVETTLNG